MIFPPAVCQRCDGVRMHVPKAAMPSPPLGYDSFDPAQRPVESPVKRGGGPKTPAGKAASRRNALKHGLTASLLLPEVLQPGRCDLYHQELQRDYRLQ